MKSGPAKSAAILNSVFYHGLDEKRRIQIPARFRPSKPGVELTLVLWPIEPDGACLRVLNPEQMADLVQDIESLPKGDPKKHFLRLFVGGNSAQVTLDGAGRILLPEKMAHDAKITDQVAIVGTLTGYQLWNPERYQRAIDVPLEQAREAFKVVD